MILPHNYSNELLLSEPVTIPPTPPTKKRTRRNSHNSKKHAPDVLLPEDFEPSNHTVIIGRGKRVRESPGNRRLRALTASLLPRYVEAADADDRATKTRLVSEVVDLVKVGEGCSDNSTYFVRKSKENGRWYEVDDGVAREKVGYVFRDLLADRYESSSKSKVAKKMQLQVAKKMQLQRQRELQMSLEKLKMQRRQSEEELQMVERQLRQHKEEEELMVGPLLELTLPSSTVQPGWTDFEDDIHRVTPISVARSVVDPFEVDLLNLPIIECLP